MLLVRPSFERVYLFVCFFASSEKSEKKEEDNRVTTLSIVKQPMFISQLIWFSFVQLRFIYFTGTLNTYLNRLFDNDTAQG